MFSCTLFPRNSYVVWAKFKNFQFNFRWNLFTGFYCTKNLVLKFWEGVLVNMFMFKYIKLAVLIWFRLNPCNLNLRNFQFLVGFSFKPIFALSPTMTTLISKDVKFSLMSKVCRILPSFSNAHAKTPKRIFDSHFLDNLFEFGVILNDFWSSIIWAIQIQVSFRELEIPKNPGIQPTYRQKRLSRQKNE